MSELRSKELRAVLAHEMERGNSVAAEETAWSRMELVIRLKNKPDGAFMREIAKRSSKLRVFDTGDPHYSSAALGIADGSEAVAGPRTEKAVRLR